MVIFAYFDPSLVVALRLVAGIKLVHNAGVGHITVTRVLMPGEVKDLT